MANIDISRYLKSKTMEEINSLTMDVSKSFLNGCPCSPLAVTPDSGMLSKAINSALSLTSSDAQRTLSYVQESTAYGYKLYQDAMTRVDSTLSSLRGMGIYINKEGKKINVQTDFVPNAISIGLGIGQSVMECVTDEATRIVNNAVTKIIEFPDTKYFSSYLTTYFGKWLNSDECKKLTADILSMGSALPMPENDNPSDPSSSPSVITNNDDPVDSEEKAAEAKEKQCMNFLNKVSYTCQTKIPEIGNWINDKTQKMVEYTALASSYAAFGKEWIENAVNKYVDDGVQHVKDFVDLKLEKILQQKQNVIDFVCQTVTDSAIEYHKKLMNDAQRLLSKEVKLKIRNAELKAKMAVISAAAKVCAKFGVPVPKFDDILSTIEKARLAEYSKKIADLARGDISSLGRTGKMISIVQQFTGNILGNLGSQNQNVEQSIDNGSVNTPQEQTSAEQSESESNEESNATPPNYLPSKEDEVGYGEDGSRWISYKYKKKLQNNITNSNNFGINVLNGVELELYAWTLVATAEQQKERYGEEGEQQERPLTDAERRLQEAQARGLAETGVTLPQAQGTQQTSGDASDPIGYLMGSTGIDRKAAQTKWKSALKTAKRMVSAHIRSASYAPGWGQLAKKPKLKNRVVDAQARIMLKIPVTDTQALNIINGRG